MYSGLAMYMLRPPTSRGMPAFGCALSFARRDRRHLLDRLENRLRADGAVEPDDVGAPRVERARDVFRRRAVGRAPVDADRHLRDHRHRRVDSSRAARIACSISCEVAERLEQEEVDAALGERLPSARGRSPRASSRLVGPYGSMRTPSGPTAPATSALVAGGLARDLRRGAIDLRDLILEPVLRELEPVRAEPVRLEHFGAGLHVRSCTSRTSSGARRFSSS